MGDFIIAAIKFVFAILLLPVVFACTIGLQEHLSTYPLNYNVFFLWGAMGFLLTFLFIYQFWGIHDFGQKIVAGMFKFLSPFDRLAAKMIPFYLTVILLVFYFVKGFLGINTYDHYFMFFAGFSLAMNILLAAQEMRIEEKTPFRPSYLFWMGIVFICNVFIIVLLLDLVLKRFTFPEFFSSMISDVRHIYSLIFEKMFLIK